MRALAVLTMLLFLAAPLAASTYTEVEKTCPIGGEKFKFMELMSISTFGEMPDGMAIGSGHFPVELPQCPGNGLVMYEDFDAPTVKKLEPIIAGKDYQSMRATESPYFLAYSLATALGESDQAPWLLLSASWDAKNADPGGASARRYNEEFVALVKAMPVSDKAFESIALRARAANALRELGRFDEAEAMRAGVVLARDAGGKEGKVNREGWANYLKRLAAPIARRETARDPIDMADDTMAASLCVDKKPLAPFETEYCKRPAIAKLAAKFKKAREDYPVMDEAVTNSADAVE